MPDFLIGNDQNPTGKMNFLTGNRYFLSAKMDFPRGFRFPYGKCKNPVSESSFPVRFSAFPDRKSLFANRIFNFPIGKSEKPNVISTKANRKCGHADTKPKFPGVITMYRIRETLNPAAHFISPADKEQMPPTYPPDNYFVKVRRRSTGFYERVSKYHTEKIEHFCHCMAGLAIILLYQKLIDSTSIQSNTEEKPNNVLKNQNQLSLSKTNVSLSLKTKQPSKRTFPILCRESGPENQKSNISQLLFFLIRRKPVLNPTP